MSEQHADASGGRAGRQARARWPPHTAHASPFLTRTLAPFEVLERGGPRAHRAQRRHHPRGGRRHLPRLPGGAARSWPPAAPTSTATGCASRAACAGRSCSRAAPAIYTQHARNPAHNVQIGGDATVFAPNYGSPFVHDLDRGRRYATLDRLRELREARPTPRRTCTTRAARCASRSTCPSTSATSTWCTRTSATATSRSWARSRPGAAPQDSRRAGPHRVRRRPRRPHGDDEPHQRLVAAGVGRARCWRPPRSTPRTTRPALITPFILAGAMAPTTVAGVAAQTLAEALAGMTFVQLVRPGAPVVFGSFASSMSMQTGAPTFGTPEPALVLYVVAQLARRLGVPFRSGGSLTASKLPDAQAAYESANTLQPTILGGVNFVLHAAGWLEGGLAIGYEKFVLDDDQLGHDGTRSSSGVDLSRQRSGARRHHRERARAALPRHRPHARQLRDRVLPLDGGRQRQLRAVARGGRARRRAAGQRASGSARWPSTSRRRSTTRSTRSCGRS